MAKRFSKTLIEACCLFSLLLSGCSTDQCKTSRVEDERVLARYDALYSLFPPETVRWKYVDKDLFDNSRNLNPIIIRDMEKGSCFEIGGAVTNDYKDTKGKKLELAFVPMPYFDHWAPVSEDDPHAQQRDAIGVRPGTLVHVEQNLVKGREYAERVKGYPALLVEVDYNKSQSLPGFQHSTTLYIYTEKADIIVSSWGIPKDGTRLIAFASALNFDALKHIP